MTEEDARTLLRRLEAGLSERIRNVDEIEDSARRRHQESLEFAERLKESKKLLLQRGDALDARELELKRRESKLDSSMADLKRRWRDLATQETAVAKQAAQAALMKDYEEKLAKRLPQLQEAKRNLESMLLAWELRNVKASAHEDFANSWPNNARGDSPGCTTSKSGVTSVEPAAQQPQEPAEKAAPPNGLQESEAIILENDDMSEVAAPEAEDQPATCSFQQPTAHDKGEHISWQVPNDPNQPERAVEDPSVSGSQEGHRQQPQPSSHCGRGAGQGDEWGTAPVWEDTSPQSPQNDQPVEFSGKEGEAVAQAGLAEGRSGEAPTIELTMEPDMYGQTSVLTDREWVPPPAWENSIASAWEPFDEQERPQSGAAPIVIPCKNRNQRGKQKSFRARGREARQKRDLESLPKQKHNHEPLPSRKRDRESLPSHLRVPLRSSPVMRTKFPHSVRGRVRLNGRIARSTAADEAVLDDELFRMRDRVQASEAQKHEGDNIPCDQH